MGLGQDEKVIAPTKVPMKSSILLAAFVLATLSLAAPAAQSAGTQVSAIEDTGMTTGVVRKLDNDQHKITLQHEAIKSLGMPPMTMVFRIGNASSVEQVNVGDRVMFRAERINGTYVVTRLTKRDVIP